MDYYTHDTRIFEESFVYMLRFDSVLAHLKRGVYGHGHERGSRSFILSFSLGSSMAYVISGIPRFKNTSLPYRGKWFFNYPIHQIYKYLLCPRKSKGGILGTWRYICTRSLAWSWRYQYLSLLAPKRGITSLAAKL